MTIKRLIIKLFLFIIILILVIPISPIHRIIRSYSIYLLHEFRPSNRGAKFIYNQFSIQLVSMPWGIKRRDLKFLVSNRLFNIDDWRSPVISEIIDETENSVSYIINESPRHTVTFYFDSNGNYYKAVQYFRPPHSHLSSLLDFNSMWLGKVLLEPKHLGDYYKGTHTYVLRWRCYNYESGFANYTYHFQGTPGFPPAFISFDFNGILWGTIPLTEYPELEIYFKMEFEGMIIEHHLRPDPDDSSLFLREAVYTSTFLTGD